MYTSSRFWVPFFGALCQGFSGPLAAGSAEASQVAWRDPYVLTLPSPEQYRLTSQQAEVTPNPLATAADTTALSSEPFAREIAKAANEFKVDPALVHAVIRVESGYNVSARSEKGAQGLMQLLPETARRFGVATGDLLWNPERNIRAGVAYLRTLLDLFEHDLSLVLAAYNAGENAVLRYGRRIPPFAETRNYVPKVLAIYGRLRPAREDPPAPPKERVRIQYPPPVPEAQPDNPSR